MNQPLKVLFINTVCGRSSTGGIIRDIDLLLKKEGYDSLCLYGRYSAPDSINSKRIADEIDVKLHVLKTRIFDAQGFGSKKSTIKAIEEIKKYQPDVIHLHNLHGSYLNISILMQFLAEYNKPVIWTIHDCWPFTGHCVYYDYIGCELWKTQCHHCPKKKTYPASLLIDRSAHNFAEKKRLFTSIKNMTIVTVSDWLKGQVEQSFLRNYPLMRIYNGINKDVFKPVESDVLSKLGLNGKYVILGVADGWSVKNGINLFKGLAEKLQKNETIVLVGFKEQQQINELPDGIIGMMRTDSVEELVKLYSAADIVLNPSYEETFGLVTAEALCCGTPVIVQNRTACPELVDDTCGVVLQDDSIEAIRKAVDSLKGKNMKEACLKRSKLFDKNNNYMQYVELYRHLVYSKEC